MLGFPKEYSTVSLASTINSGDPPRQRSQVRMDTCDTSNGYDGRMGLRISSIFVILVGSLFGAVFPVLAKRLGGNGIPSWTFFIAKYFGSGVIIATAFIHLLAPAEEALTNPCLTGPITEYSWVEGIVLMTIVVMFFVELMVMRNSFPDGHGHGHSHGDEAEHSHDHSHLHAELPTQEIDATTGLPINTANKEHEHIPGNNHLSHTRDHRDLESAKSPLISAEEYAAQLTAVFILEFGIIFHSVFIGLTLAVSGNDFITLYIVLVFHQTFEGLGLGSRLATLPWPESKRFTPYLLGIGYAISTPIAIAIGLGVRHTYPPGGRTTLIVNGVFDSISAGVLIYTALVELMAHEFMFSSSMRRAPLSTVLWAFFLICLGAALMALLGKWA
ncbi:plasma membrane low affinity zinc ion transporter, putative [Talaromyces stipitatus ATCC 10500]|uniref:Plasma membrane low affinity zinc ion transporter, putative n=1 Tax=Talaromyces stipitatus (strain ATCC 10500 / CBS 375.48 / QM 6759 / NRRL 1006) TaxID=441959 RepID=B8MJG8_TALSN|nr:plasma membrane low affinity zinc ion transporter, putative [Talaromyces stipitatus ATCC 10500]EED15168.1 plasma membrane low affinity zinc ion transporter, putative [Talaromyces stipitatus ATCC 10500]